MFIIKYFPIITMIIVTHTLATLLLLKLFSVSNSWVIFFTLFFGIAIDFDELIIFYRDWNSTRSVKKFFKKVSKKQHRRNWFDEAGGLAISFTVSLFLGSFVPFLANLVHCIMDWSCDFDSNPLAPFYNKLETRGFVKSGLNLTRILQEGSLIVFFSLFLFVIW